MAQLYKVVVDISMQDSQPLCSIICHNLIENRSPDITQQIKFDHVNCRLRNFDYAFIWQPVYMTTGFWVSNCIAASVHLYGNFCILQIVSNSKSNGKH